jgi:hypothetical protein
MSRRLIILNNVFFLDRLSDSYDEVFYAPIFRSTIQKDFYKECYNEIKMKYPFINWSENVELIKGDKVLSWNAENEQQAFGESILPFQNRLLENLDFEIKGSFTNFKKKVELVLPEKFSKFSVPYDKNLIKELNYYFDDKKLALTYFETRNELIGRDFSTKFSKYLSSGLLDVRYLYNKVKDFEEEYGSNKSTYWIIFELLWREFFYWHYQDYGKYYFSKTGIKESRYDFSKFKLYTIEELKSLTDIRFFHAALNELSETGFLSNRVRQMFASIWINDLKLDWRSGAEFFESYLLDYDVYSNYGNWMYLAGVGVDPRGKRYFNIEKQLHTYDLENTYLSKWYWP